MPFRRYLVVTVVVAVSIALGFLLRLDVNSYLLLSLLLTLVFQLLLRRHPLREVWVRAMPPFRLDAAGIGIAVVLSLVPLYEIYTQLQLQAWAGILYGLVSIGGAVAAAYAIRQMRRTTLRQLLLCLATAGVIGIALQLIAQYGAVVARHQPLQFNAGVWALSFLEYIPALFVVEEVLFRGALDGYLHEGETGTGWVSAIFLSALWGLWHIPVTGTWLSNIAVLLLLQIAVGVPLSYWMRRSGNLIVPATSHAVIDSVRNAMGAIP
jgi:membrane protease YdiL (CAAX protease family)